MIVIDSSAVLAVLLEESAADGILAKIKTASPLLMSTANVLECVMRLAPRNGQDRTGVLDRMLSGLPIQVIAVDEAQLRLARAGFMAYGKGRHPAGLNFGDCFAYALAMSRDAPLLFIGDDFRKTDIKIAM